MLTIGRLARCTGTSAETIRYYERIGLLPRPERLPSGYRVYRKDDVRRLIFIRRAKALGFTLAEIGELLALSEDETVDCGAIRAQAQAKIREIDRRMADLARMRDGLGELARYCPGAGRPLAECSILGHFFAGETGEAATSEKGRKTAHKQARSEPAHSAAQPDSETAHA
ncbi:MAG: hypothetical protein KatS3mg119_0619 [Rhodothalassiaceae bacterium]|nr:MAG: hypothetical protein KatS3mg119_0619 [Rhodothalassiaceae bacterium]